MKKIKLYLDFDGVILDTINTSYKMLKKQGIDIAYHSSGNTEIETKVRKFYRELDWAYLLSITTDINNGLYFANKIINSNLYNVEVLTHINSTLEGTEKINYCKKYIPGINVILTPRDIAKCDMVNSTDAILVDDFIPNLDSWYNKLGIPIKFSDAGKQTRYPSISSLGELITRYDEIEEMYNNPKKRIKK